MTRGPVVRKWVKADVDEAAALALADTLQVHPRMARLLVGRGVRDLEAARRYLKPELKDLHDPFSMMGAQRAAERLADAIIQREPITLYGDYDVDGVTSTALLKSFLSHHGVDAGVYIPKRLIEGYGLNAEAVDILAARGTRVLVTLDCGITASEEVARANQRGMDCVVVDHHRCPPELPPAFAVLNPHQPGCTYPEQVFAAVGVAFNLIIALRKVLRDRGFYASNSEPNLRKELDLVALGTIADMVPLTGVNRLLTRYGVDELKIARRPGIRALMEIAKVRPSRADSGDVAFKLAPRINAAGRLSDATMGVRLLLTEDMAEARHLASSLDAANGSRQQIEADVFFEAAARVDKLATLPEALVLADPAWHPGVVGIVCSRLVERYDRPAVLIGEGGRGSARTARGLHLYDALADCADYLLKFGGHRAAAGLRIPYARVEAFREAFLARVRQDPNYGGETEALLVYDDDLAAADIDDRCYRDIAQLEPFGNGNPEPLFRVPQVRVRQAKVVGEDHLKLRLQEHDLQAIAFKRGDMQATLPPGRPLELACHLELNEWSGVENLELKVKDLRTLDA